MGGGVGAAAGLRAGEVEAAARALGAGAVGAGRLLQVHHALPPVLRARRHAARVRLAEGRDAVAGRAQGAARADDVHHAVQAVRRAQQRGACAGPAEDGVLLAALRVVALAVVDLALADVRGRAVGGAEERRSLAARSEGRRGGAVGEAALRIDHIHVVRLLMRMTVNRNTENGISKDWVCRTACVPAAE